MSYEALIHVNTDLERLEQAVLAMQSRNPDLSVDDCCDAIFAVGMLAVGSTLNLTEKPNE